MRNEKMIIAAFGQASVSKTLNGAWMHPKSDPNVLDPTYYINLARSLEHYGFDMIFFDDRWAMPATYGDSPRAAVERGTRAIKLDLLVILGLIAANTSRLGLGATYSTTYFHPYHVARAFATLDHMSNGRAIWNIVTSLNEEEALNFGAEFLHRDERYDRADEFLEVATGLWDTWDEDAYQLDRATGQFADPEKVRVLDYRGKYFSSRGPLTVPKTPQGWPTLLQAGQSGRGRQFAARWADLIFTQAPNKQVAQKNYREQHEAFAAGGRSIPPAKILPAVTVLVGETAEIARDKKQFLDELGDPVEALMLVAELSGLDFEKLPLDKPFPEEIQDQNTGSASILRGFFTALEQQYGPDATPRDLGEMIARGTGSPWFIGSPEQVADGLEEWFEDEACDGFVLAQADTPGTWDDFGRMALPELRRRGLARELVDGPQTFRERVGLPQRNAR